jgi:cyanophycinase
MTAILHVFRLSLTAGVMTSLMLPLAVMAGDQPPPATPNPAHPGVLVVAGGGMRTASDEMWREILAARLDDRPVGIISTASERPEATGRPYAERINREHGEGSAIYIPLGDADGQASSEDTVKMIEACGGLFFTGGIQRRTTRILLDDNGAATPALAAIRALHQRGGVIGGSSAGAAIMSDPMIAGGSSAAALRHGATPANPAPPRRGVAYAPGIGFHPGVLYCQHHHERGRFGRLVAALASPDLPFDIGIGVAEDTAFVVDFARHSGRVIGAGGVFFIDASKVERNGRAIRGLRMHSLDHGDAIDLETGEITPAAGKSEVTNPSAPQGDDRPPAAAWDRDAIWVLLNEMAATGGVDAPAIARDARHELRFAKSADTRIWRNPAEAPDSRPSWTITAVDVEIAPLAKGDEPSR